MASDNKPVKEESEKTVPKDKAEHLWDQARTYVNLQDQMDWVLSGLVSKPTLLEIFKCHVDGDRGGIGQSTPPHGADEALDLDVFELKEDSWHVENSGCVGDLHRYLMKPADITNRVFVVNKLTSGVVGLLGSCYDLDPTFFSNHLSQVIPYHQRIPSVIAACNFMTFRYGRADASDSWVVDRISVAKQEKSGCSNIFVLASGDAVRDRQSLSYKMFAPSRGSGELWTTVSAVIAKQISHRRPRPQTSDPAYDPWFTIVYTVLAIVISEMMFLLSARDRNTLFVLNGLNRLQFAVTRTDKEEAEMVTREFVSTAAIGQASLPENYDTLIDHAELALLQFENVEGLFTSWQVKEKVKLTRKDLEVLVAYAKSVAKKHSLVNERTAQVFGPGRYLPRDEDGSRSRDDSPIAPPQYAEVHIT